MNTPTRTGQPGQRADTARGPPRVLDDHATASRSIHSTPARGTARLARTTPSPYLVKEPAP